MQKPRDIDEILKKWTISLSCKLKFKAFNKHIYPNSLTLMSKRTIESEKRTERERARAREREREREQKEESGIEGGRKRGGRERD